MGLLDIFKVKSIPVIEDAPIPDNTNDAGEVIPEYPKYEVEITETTGGSFKWVLRKKAHKNAYFITQDQGITKTHDLAIKNAKEIVDHDRLLLKLASQKINIAL